MTSITEETDNALSHQLGQNAPRLVSMTDRNLHSGTLGSRLRPPHGQARLKASAAAWVVVMRGATLRVSGFPLVKGVGKDLVPARK